MRRIGGARLVTCPPRFLPGSGLATVLGSFTLKRVRNCNIVIFFASHYSGADVAWAALIFLFAHGKNFFIYRVAINQ